jgi:hypothetical protein
MWKRLTTSGAVAMLGGLVLLGAACYTMLLAVLSWMQGSGKGNWLCAATPLLVGASVGCFPYYVRRGRLRRPGICAACGYDRAGLEEGAVCPECGAEIG